MENPVLREARVFVLPVGMADELAYVATQFGGALGGVTQSPETTQQAQALSADTARQNAVLRLRSAISNMNLNPDDAARLLRQGVSYIAVSRSMLKILMALKILMRKILKCASWFSETIR